MFKEVFLNTSIIYYSHSGNIIKEAISIHGIEKNEILLLYKYLFNIKIF